MLTSLEKEDFTRLWTDWSRLTSRYPRVPTRGGNTSGLPPSLGGEREEKNSTLIRIYKANARRWTDT